MDTKRDRDKNFTREELMAIEAAATAEGNELVDQMAGVMLTAEEWFEKETEKTQMLLSAARVWLAASHPPEGSLAERLHSNLKEIVDGMSGDYRDPELVEARMKATGIDLKFRTHWASRLVAASMAKSLKKDDGSYWNNITYELHDPRSGDTYYVEVQRKSGKTVKQQLTDAEARVKELEAVIEAECKKFNFPDEDRPELWEILNKNKETLS